MTQDVKTPYMQVIAHIGVKYGFRVRHEKCAPKRKNEEGM